MHNQPIIPPSTLLTYGDLVILLLLAGLLVLCIRTCWVQRPWVLAGAIVCWALARQLTDTFALGMLVEANNWLPTDKLVNALETLVLLLMLAACWRRPERPRPPAAPLPPGGTLPPPDPLPPVPPLERLRRVQD